MGNNKRSQWTSGFGFIMAAAGASIGLGNIWGFPYKLGEGGGFVFLLCYLFFVVTAGYPILLGEFALGRHFARGAVGTYTKLNRKFRFIGVMGIISCFIVFAYYNYFGGIIVNYVAQYGKSILRDGISGSVLTHSGSYPFLWLLVFSGATLLIVLGGVEKGIERCSKIMMPALFIMLIYLAGKSLMLPGAGEAISYLFAPDFSKFSLKTLSSALMQVFFSLSLGQGIMITYGSYLGKDANLERAAVAVPFFDTASALLAGIVIIPAVFSFGMEPDAGPGLMFEVIPRIFSAMNGGNLFGFLFFLLLLFASLTSTISMLETVASSLTEELPIKKKTASLTVFALIALAGIPICLNPGLFPVYEFVAQHCLMTLGILLTCIILGWYWKPESAISEITGENSSFVSRGYWRFMIKYITPLLVFFVFLVAVGIIKVENM